MQKLFYKSFSSKQFSNITNINEIDEIMKSEKFSVNVFFFMITKIFLQQLFSILDYKFLYAKWKRYNVEKYYANYYNLNQSELNMIFENPSFDFYNQYAKINMLLHF